MTVLHYIAYIQRKDGIIDHWQRHRIRPGPQHVVGLVVVRSQLQSPRRWHLETGRRRRSGRPSPDSDPGFVLPVQRPDSRSPDHEEVSGRGERFRDRV